jgi:hypothetical protein
MENDTIPYLFWQLPEVDGLGVFSRYLWTLTISSGSGTMINTFLLGCKYHDVEYYSASQVTSSYQHRMCEISFSISQSQPRFSTADPLHCFVILLPFIDMPFNSTPKALLIVPIESLDAPNNSSNSGTRIQKVIDVSAVVNTNLTRLVLSDEKLKALLAITGRIVSNIVRIANY